MLYVDAINKARANPDAIALFASKIAGTPGPKASTIALCLTAGECVPHQPQGATARAGVWHLSDHFERAYEQRWELVRIRYARG